MTSRLPRRIAWFAPWTWKRRHQALLLVVLTLAGLLASAAAFMLAENFVWTDVAN
jgi:hypothetical protein